MKCIISDMLLSYKRVWMDNTFIQMKIWIRSMWPAKLHSHKFIYQLHQYVVSFKKIELQPRLKSLKAFKDAQLTFFWSSVSHKCLLLNFLFPEGLSLGSGVGGLSWGRVDPERVNSVRLGLTSGLDTPLVSVALRQGYTPIFSSETA